MPPQAVAADKNNYRVILDLSFEADGGENVFNGMNEYTDFERAPKMEYGLILLGIPEGIMCFTGKSGTAPLDFVLLNGDEHFGKQEYMLMGGGVDDWSEHVRGGGFRHALGRRSPPGRQLLVAENYRRITSPCTVDHFICRPYERLKNRILQMEDTALAGCPH